MSTTSHPEAKRKRTDEPETAADSPLFKVYKGLLAANSTVFADMFLVPQPPPSKGELIEGCTVIRLSDSAVDVTYVLEALCKRRHATAHEPVSIAIVAAFVRLGQKYQIDAVLSEALGRLYYEFPDDLDDVDEADNWTKISESAGIFIDVANLAREQNLLSALPLALRYCSLEDSDDIVKGVAREDHTVATLSPINERVVLAAKDPLLRLQSTTTFSWLIANGSDDFAMPACCNTERMQLVVSKFFPLPEYDGLKSWEEGWEDSICAACVVKAKALHASGRQRYWNKLPSIFGLPDWEELEKERVLSAIIV
ncbi:hypothetical protein FIBSPDRAFT_1038996 [Athelia psychrophila]|uniref:BTB domain-containing protein n=1 Tax=Athelia psychrophila TaxID=1759441 RepID=A0A166SDS5_9AGAM|nr:hypothetical protein FIBSPDRAFT_1038996 [Fibularhizoctonia sp. CBS 109695]